MEAIQLALTREGAVRLEVRARPRAHTCRIAAVRGGALVVQVTAPPSDGAANAELTAALAWALSVTKRQVALVRGAASRTKLVEIFGLGIDEVRRRLMAAIG
jgi:uncharacterized protein YggU (UPF0235/DUF167 family)